jgi:hypothetical protein
MSKKKKKKLQIESRHVFYSIIFSPLKRAVYDIMWEKCDRAGKATDDGAYPRIIHGGTEGE